MEGLNDDILVCQPHSWVGRAGMMKRRTLFGVVATLAAPRILRAQTGANTLRFVPQADLRILDPVWSTGYITRNYAYLVYDTLLARDDTGAIRPQMVEGWTSEPDGLGLTFRLRPSLAFHDGMPVRAADCVASIRRWAARDPAGRRLMAASDALDVVDDRTFRFRFKQPFPAALSVLSRYSSAPFIMPERNALTDPNNQVTDAIGSGPFSFVRGEWLPGQRTVFARNPHYVPREEAPSGSAGGKVVHVDRVEWTYLPDAATATAALTTGEVDWLGYPDADLVSQLRTIPGITVRSTDPYGVVTVGRFNTIQPPFDNPAVRRAAVAAIGRRDVLEAVGGDPKNWIACDGAFACAPGHAGSTNAGSDIAAAKRLLAASGYHGERAVLLSSSDQSIIALQVTIAADLLTRAGMTVDLQTLDTSTVQSRRTSRAPVDRGGWSMFFTWFAGADLMDPSSDIAISATGATGWFGWLDDPETERLTDRWYAATDDTERAQALRRISARTDETAPYVITGQFRTPTAYRNSISGILDGPVPFFWNVKKV
jgi:peptide/nickel transport system substrate-binding protein